MAEREFIDDPSLPVLAQKVISDRKMDWLINVPIKYLLVTPEISKTTHGKIIKSGAELKYFSGVVFVIEFSHKIWSVLDDKTREILMYHELLHIIISQQNPKAPVAYKLAPHSVQDFSEIIDTYGVKWINEFKQIVVSTYDLQGEQKDQITI